jgi:hypothetical protein
MDAFVEHLCEHVVLIRVGAGGSFPAPYRYSVTVRTHGSHAEPVGFDHPKISRSEFELLIRTINSVTGKLVAYDRAGPPVRRMIQLCLKSTKGKIVMAPYNARGEDGI